MSDQEVRDRLPLLQSATAQLMEHFDTVRIFVSKFDAEDDMTLTLTWGGGNILAQQGQVQEWLAKQRRRTEVEVEKEDDEP